MVLSKLQFELTGSIHLQYQFELIYFNFFAHTSIDFQAETLHMMPISMLITMPISNYLCCRYY